MANQQLVDYVKGQLQAGVKEEDIKKVLKDAGWPDAEVGEGISVAKGPVVSNPVVAQPESVAVHSPIQSGQFAGQVSAGVSAKPIINAFGGSISSPTVTATTSSAKPEEKKEVMKFDFVSNPIASKGSGETSTFKPQDSKTEVSSATLSSPVNVSSGGKRSLVPWILFAVAVVALGATATMLYMNNLSLKESSTSLQTQLQAVQGQLTTLQGSGSDLATQLSALNAEKQDILDEIAIFSTPALVPIVSSATSTSGTSTQPVMQMPTSVAFRVKGVITQDSKGVYIITTARNVVLMVKNSKDVNLDTALKPMVGQNTSASFSGVHSPMSKDLTVESVNGASVK